MSGTHSRFQISLTLRPGSELPVENPANRRMDLIFPYRSLENMFLHFISISALLLANHGMAQTKTQSVFIKTFMLCSSAKIQEDAAKLSAHNRNTVFIPGSKFHQTFALIRLSFTHNSDRGPP
ncbi:MAG: hypothetical protein WCI92_15765 [Bacteroidota bacterium]